MMCSPVATFGESPSPRSFHASVVIGDLLYVHGGMDKSNRVLASLHSFNVTTKTWCVVETVPSSHKCKVSGVLPDLGICEAPSLSNHCALNYKDRFIMLIGGWNGKRRTSDVFLFDVGERSWNQMRISGDIPVGLSSHTASMVTEDEILIVGREGGVHTHRRSGDAFSLNPKTGEYKTAMYSVDSRSGHISCMVSSSDKKKYRILIYSGRKTGNQYSFIGSWNTVYDKENNVHRDISNRITALVKKSKRIELLKGRQNSRHFCIDYKIVVIYGGQLWQARDSVSSDVIVFNTENNLSYVIETDSSLPKLTGFTLNVGSDCQCYIFGGNDGRTSNNSLWNLQAR